MKPVMEEIVNCKNTKEPRRLSSILNVCENGDKYDGILVDKDSSNKLLLMTLLKKGQTKTSCCTENLFIVKLYKNVQHEFAALVQTKYRLVTSAPF